MLKLAVRRVGPLCAEAALVRPAATLLAHQRWNSTDALLRKDPDQLVAHGAEGLHRQDSSPVKQVALETADGVSTVPSKIHGDWVLFHPTYSVDELKAPKVINREPSTVSDRIARLLVKFMRIGFDIASRYTHKDIPPDSNMSVQELREKKYLMSPDQWLQRAIFLETIAAVPGMVAATVRHLSSLRLMRRDSGWIHTLLEEAENERMHLMTFMALRRPGLFFRAFVLGAQGVFYNAFFLSYLIAPRICHRFVGYLEEEAVLTYTRCIDDIEGGRLPEWADQPAPAIAIDYWRLKPDASLLDVIYAIRSDETNHRFVNHT